MLHNKLAKCRAEKGINKSQFARRLGMTRGYVTRLEQGKIKPSIDAALRMARYFGKPVEQLFQLEDSQISNAGAATHWNHKSRRNTE